tara:strand:- start:9093 stop:9863 length:771 start_codon:yes stop_codon:yes gene_type:complete
MFYDLIYNGCIISGAFLTLELMGKYNKNEIQNVDDVKQYLMFKGLNILNMYNKSTRHLNNFLKRCGRQIEEDDEDEEDYEDTYKIVLLNSDNEIIKGLLTFEGEDYHLEDEDDELNNNIEKAKIIFISHYIDKKYIEIHKDELDFGDEKKMNSLRKKIENIIHDKKLLLNVQLINGEHEYDLNHILDKYYVVGNKILTKIFIEFILQEEIISSEKLSEKYKINIIDKNVTMIELNENQNIEIFKEEDEIKYKIFKS